MELLIFRIAVYFDQLHTVKQRPRNGLCGIGGSDKEHLGQIQRYLHIVISEPHILLAVQNFQKSGRGISLIVAADLIDLIQQHQRIAYASLTQSVRQTARHGSHIGLSV